MTDVTVNPVSSTYFERGTFPSDANNHFRALECEVVQDVPFSDKEPVFVEAAFALGNGESVTRLVLSAFSDEPDAVASMRSDLQYLKQQVADVVDAALAALDEVA